MWEGKTFHFSTLSTAAKNMVDDGLSKEHVHKRVVV